MKRPVIDKDLEKLIQEYANANTDGNFTKAVDELIRGSLLSRQVFASTISIKDYKPGAVNL
jgi:hypothetical protein